MLIQNTLQGAGTGATTSRIPVVLLLEWHQLLKGGAQYRVYMT